ncbi:MAG: hypothetical protein JW956_09265 [Calditrichaceae bacterium]|nr:hypothetical protein [Calditrichaceae bacterium]
MEKIFLISLFFIIICLNSCEEEGIDAAFFDTINELIITGKNKGNFKFQNDSTEMIVNFYTNSSFMNDYKESLSLSFIKTNKSGNRVPVDEVSVNFLEVLSPGDYYAYSFIDLNHNYYLDKDEPYDEWSNESGVPKVIQVTERSRWKIVFEFKHTYSIY